MLRHDPDIMLIGVKQRAKLTRFRAKTASNIDHPKNVKILHL